jgi:hypothetical protein
MSHNGFEELSKIESVIDRSKKALENLQKVRANLRSYKDLYHVIRKLHSTG